jgi:hypothetical protein
LDGTTVVAGPSVVEEVEEVEEEEVEEEVEKKTDFLITTPPSWDSTLTVAGSGVVESYDMTVAGRKAATAKMTSTDFIIVDV